MTLSSRRHAEVWGLGLEYTMITSAGGSGTSQGSSFCSYEQRTWQEIPTTLQQVWKFLSVKMKPKENLTSLLYSQRNKNPHDDMLPETKKILTSFYEVYNHMLAEFLNDTRYRWHDNWFQECAWLSKGSKFIYTISCYDPHCALTHAWLVRSSWCIMHKQNNKAST